jgi:predicted enzyme related to lactoylglutathione lyase
MPAETNGPIAVNGMHFVLYLTDDLPKTRAFYEALFALKPGAYDSEYFVEYDLPDGSTFTLAHDPRGPRVPCGGAMFGVDDAEAAIARVEALGGKVLARQGGDKCTSGWCADPEGTPFGVHQRL